MQYNALAYIGVCGGALLAGADPYDGTPGLDLLQGAKIRYDANCGSADVDVQSCKDLFQFTSGCGFGIYCWQTIRRAVSFPCVKNGAKWCDFATSNTVALEGALTEKVNLPGAFRYGDELWFFSLAGYVYVDGKWIAIDSEKQTWT